MQGGSFRGAGGGGDSETMSTVSRDDNMVMSSEDSSSPEQETELELGLGLSIGGVCFKGHQQNQLVKKGQYARILTSKDLPSLVSASSSSSSTSSSSFTLSKVNNGTAGIKRSADSVTVPNGSACQVIGWPPIRTYRMNSMVNNQSKSVANEEFNSMMEENRNKNIVIAKSSNGGTMNIGNAKGRTSPFVKVNMDGTPIGRKVDLNAHGCYETLAQTLEDMFLTSTSTVTAIRSSIAEHNLKMNATRCPKLLDGSSDFVLTYEDKDGDWMLVGDVPWSMFLGSVKRLRIMRRSEATGLSK